MFLDDPMISMVVFYPRKTKMPDGSDPNVRAIEFQIDNEIKIGGICYVKDTNLPTILLFHGNGEVAEDYQYFLEPYFEIGVNLAVVDFRGYGFSTGRPIYSGLITDAMPIYTQFLDWLHENGFANSLFIKGRSLGSVCASEIGAHNPKDVKGIIFESGFASIYNMMTRLFGVRGPNITTEALEEFSNDTRIKKFQKPTLIIHGTNDTIVPFEEGELIYESIPEGIDKKLVEIPHAGHNDIFYYQDQYFPKLKEFITKYK